MSIYAANNIARAVQRLAKRGDAGLAGIICNSNGDEAFEHAFIPAFAKKLGTSFVQFVPRSPLIQACELEGRTACGICSRFTGSRNLPKPCKSDYGE